MPVLARFAVTRPPHEISQAHSLDWLARAHGAAEATLAGLTEDERRAFTERMRRLLARCACPPDRIAKRGVSLPELGDDAWGDHALYDLARHPHGRRTRVRTELYGELVDAFFERAYALDEEPPDDLIHVTCTGYLSPSGAQKLVAGRGWSTRVTHAYHMGCYASVPALRLAAGAIATGSARVDVVHTELCSLHLDPADHRVEQLVVQSLFADGMIRYAMLPDGPGLRVLAVHEEILPDSADAMTWRVADHGMLMSLARDVPQRIGSRLRDFVRELYRRGGHAGEPLGAARFAVHPGGPKIIDSVRDVLELAEPQLEASRGVLLEHGNMSSATLPHIWARFAADPTVPPGTLVPSLAFGPGLTMCGALLEKV
jgi:predicted naringenin-chalcone synthase